MPTYWTDDGKPRENKKPNRMGRREGDIPAPPGQEEEEKHHPSSLCPCEMCQSRWVGADCLGGDLPSDE